MTVGSIVRNQVKTQVKKKAINWVWSGLAATVGIPILIFTLAGLCLVIVLPIMLLAGGAAWDDFSSDYISGGGPVVSPIAGSWVLTSGFGEDRGDHYHMGIDLAAPAGTPVLAVVAGRVTISSSGAGGLEIYLAGEDGRLYYYAHLSGYAVSSGQRVTQGSTIGYIGSTGRSTGPHLHFQVKENGRWVNPLEVLNKLVPEVLPNELSFKPINRNEVSAWLANRKSRLADYVDIFERVGQKYNVNPLLLLAITGQEQSFVPVGSSDKMLGNPFNVYGSWVSYSPGLEQSAEIAAKTINRLSLNRPPGVHPIQWINSPSNPRGMYATDQSWWVGVSKFLGTLERVAGSGG
ncbi:M23 family metallopeptidase [Desulforamulus aquiferis]|uniref:Peptidoglycan DD-metalloendopeptidase family protein n=1 Tax=Desulforamulus aquiferis TaxID=1397668 RepID=A0AAW7Z8R9_9FIRM|nr:peptidoglycan DD-metalloendopeptidase family protein [Desulforamulus aquiferis]MDO7785815.1 peptidoglycan DD-metalloendopeptidase family protein [Desulforamulus aquiferis]